MPAQLEFLKSRRVSFSAAQQEKRLPIFWTNVYQEFFTQWPNPASEIDETPDNSSTKKKKKASNSPDEKFASEEDWIFKRKQVRHCAHH